MPSYRIYTASEMRSLGTELASHHRKICLIGDLGAGKTTLTQGLCGGRLPNHPNITSPTYTYSHVYENLILHVDMYRLQTWGQAIGYGIADQIQHYPYIVIERPKFTSEYYQSDWLTIDIHIQTDHSRMVYLINH